MHGSPPPGQIPVVLLTGFLGAGKTTLLNHLLSLPEFRERQLALVINEFGPIGVDGDLVGPGDYAKYEINKGSLFCICVKTDFLSTLEAIAVTSADMLLVEATGVAETRDLLGFVEEPHLRDRFRIAADICVVDALNFTKVAPNLRAAVSQVCWADGIVLNKCDLVGASDLEKLTEVLASMNPTAPVISVSFGRVPAGFVGSLTHRPCPELPAQVPPQAIFSASFETQEPVRRAVLVDLLCSLRRNILRLKGQVDFGDGPVFVEVVNEVLQEKPAVAGRPGTRFVVVAWNMRQAELEGAFQAALGE
jgi:G3E family GTPase